MGIQGNVAVALFDLAPDHPHYEIFKNIEKNIKSGSRLTSQLLGYARKGRYEVKPMELNKLIKDISDTFARARKEITITHDFANDLAPVEADEGQIEQVFLNILVNSGQAMPRGGKIFIETKNVTHEVIENDTFKVKPGKYVMIKVTDTGTGMDEETIKHIFEPFFTTKEMGRGTGLGLASSYGIIKGHSGYVSVESAPGKGASFFVYLPVTDKTVSEKITVNGEALNGKETILFVDDEQIVLNVGAKILEKLGYEVIKCVDAEQAVDLYKERYNDIDLVILDIIMPNMSGGEVFDTIKKINPNAKVLLSSGYSIDGHAKSILDRGCNGFIQKPFSMEELSEKMREVMDP
jgi:CheY-like chemotaxis protein